MLKIVNSRNKRKTQGKTFNVLHEQSYDDTLVIDDFNHEDSSAETKRKMKNIRGLIRAYSDKTPRAKYGGSDNVKRYALRGVCVFTGETRLTGQLKSGELRYIKVFVHLHPDLVKLSAFQEHPELMLALYSEWIHYLQRNYLRIIYDIQKYFQQMRTSINSKEPRMKDAFIHLYITKGEFINFIVEAGVLNSQEAAHCMQSGQNLLLQT